MKVFYLLGIFLCFDMRIVLAKANDVELGRQLYETKCIACHSVDENRIGPKHVGIVGRKVGRVAGYSYSAALKNANTQWTPRLLDAWLTDPEAVFPGQKMAFRLSDIRERQLIIEYLKTLK